MQRFKFVHLTVEENISLQNFDVIQTPYNKQIDYDVTIPIESSVEEHTGIVHVYLPKSDQRKS